MWYLKIPQQYNLLALLRSRFIMQGDYGFKTNFKDVNYYDNNCDDVIILLIIMHDIASTEI